jgi:UDP-glucose 4-epimerase
MKHVLVTGGNGFIGGYVVDELVANAYEPIVLDRRLPGRAATHYFGDIKDYTLVDDAIGHVDGVIHLAGILGTQETIADPLPAAETNILGGLNVIRSCAKYDVPLVNIAVGNWWMNNTYSITKNTIERFVAMKRTYEGAPMTSVRALNAYGPRQVPTEPYGPSRVRKIMPSFICRTLSGEPIEIYGDGEQVMDMIYVADVAKILVRTLEHVAQDKIPEATVEAGSGNETDVNKIAEMVFEAAHGRAPLFSDITHLAMRPGEPERSVVRGDPSTLAQVGIKIDDLTPFAVGVKKTVEYFREYLSSGA